MTSPLTIKVCSEPFCAALTELSSLLVESAKNVTPSLVEAIQGGAKLCVLDCDHGAAPVTGELLYVLKPSQGLLMLVAAARAGNLDAGVIEQAFGHGASPSVGVATPMVDESAAVAPQTAAADSALAGDIPR
ncbi:hypothetical protein X566_20000 [Afipia sp. P52-10]|nr:hypothetical protein X566_20000 [Afipia sp. P52-10]